MAETSAPVVARRGGCRDGYSADSTRAAALFRELTLARADGSLRSLLAHLARIDVVPIDDWAMAPFGEAGRRGFREICEVKRHHQQAAGLVTQREGRETSPGLRFSTRNRGASARKGCPRRRRSQPASL